MQTLRHFFPNLLRWLDALPDTRNQEAITYPRRFLALGGILLYVLQLGSRRQLDYQLDARDTEVLANLNRLAETDVATRPVQDTLDHYLEHTTVAGLLHRRQQCLQRLLRRKVLDDARLHGPVVVSGDGPGWVSFGRRHGDPCLQYRHKTPTVYRHQVFEWKLLGPSQLALSIGTEFIENESGWGACGDGVEARLPPIEDLFKPGCAVRLRTDLPTGRGPRRELRRGVQGSRPALWAEFQQLLRLVPGPCVERDLPHGTRQVYRWVKELDYTDSNGRRWRLHAVQCEETNPKGQTTRFAWLTRLRVTHDNVIALATQGGRYRWHIENQGFNRQKNSGLNLEHLYSTDAVKLKLYYLLLPSAPLWLQLLEQGSLWRQLAAAQGQGVWQWLGSLKNLAQRLLESLRNRVWPAACFDVTAARRLRLRLDTS